MYKNILVPVSFEPGRKREESLRVAEEMLDPGGKITALHVLEEVPSYIAQYLPEGQVEQNHAEVEKILREELAAHPKIELKVVDGHAGHTIVDYAKEHGVDCIVIASHRPGLQDVFLGSTAARVVRHAPCSVHVVR
ncbi:MAG: universal stress protein [Alphaproteobacteria bacterium]|nr:MAG: universal stress protein [Alphaproteobacteria bacterium]